MVIEQGDIWWADLREPIGSEPGFRRPVVIVQANEFTRSRIQTVVCVILTSNINIANAKGNVLLPGAVTGLPKDSVANISQILTIDKTFLTEHVGSLDSDILNQILDGIELLLGRI
jgi:mRNA interferase MazF